MVRPADLSPEQLYKFDQLSKKVSRLDQMGNGPDGISEEDAKFVEEMMDGILGLACPTLPLDEIPFMAKVMVVSNYKEEISESDPKAEAAEQQTGE